MHTAYNGISKLRPRKPLIHSLLLTIHFRIPQHDLKRGERRNGVPCKNGYGAFRSNSTKNELHKKKHIKMTQTKSIKAPSKLGPTKMLLATGLKPHFPPGDLQRSGIIPHLQQTDVLIQCFNIHVSCLHPQIFLVQSPF